MEINICKYVVYHWAGRFLYLGPLLDSTEHSHHALQLTLNREGHCRLGIEDSPIECGGVLVRSDCRHQLLSTNDSQIHLLIDNEDEVARAITRRHLGDGKVKILEGALLDRLLDCVETPGNYLGPCGQAHEVVGNIVSELGGYAEPSEKTVDPRIQAVMNLLRENHLSQKTTAAELARHACLSESRLIHLFTEEIGIPLRRYVLWVRLMTAVQLATKGKSLTEAAHSAGFSDSAHLSRTWRRMTGLTLSECVKHSEFVQIISCLS